MNDEKRKKLEMNTKNLLELLGEDPSREGPVSYTHLRAHETS